MRVRPTVLSRSSLALAALLALAGCAQFQWPAAPGAVTPASATASTPASAPAVAAAAPAPRPVARSTPVPPTGTTAAAGAATAPRPPASAPTAAPAPGSPPSFDSVTKDATRSDGLIAVWRKDDKVWLELKPEDFDKPFFLSPKLSKGLGEGVLFGGMMMPSRVGRAQVVEFRRVHNTVHLVARNLRYVANPATPEARAVERGFADSMLSGAPVASQPHPQRNTVLVDAAPLFLGDLMGLAPILQQTYRQGYSLDPRYTGFTSVRSMPDQLALDVRAHFATPSLASAPPVSLPGAPVPTVPGSLADPRSMLLGVYYSISKMPEQPMKPRRADPRLGHFTSSVDDFSTDARPSTRVRHIDRWRLEKKDPAAALSEPVKPITFWIDRTVPLRYREAVTAGIVEWNKAFEKIGFKDAIVARVQPDDATFDTLDVGVASVRWITTASPRFDGYGPSVTDPRSGEILDADIVIDAGAARTMRTLRAQVLDGATDLNFPALMQFPRESRAAHAAHAAHDAGPDAACEFGAHLSEQMGYALEVLAARGDIGPDDETTQQFAIERVKAVTVHEIGHALGLRHNFRSSRAYTLAQLADPVFTAANGITASVMDYPDLNLPPPGTSLAQHGAVFRTGLGPYDYWAIEYAYLPLEPAAEKQALQRIAERGTDPLLAYGTDEDNSLGIDPESLTFDLGDDPVAYARQRFAIARDLIRRQESRTLRGDQNYTALRRAVRFAVRDVAVSAGILARQIGGVRTLRDFPGSGRDPLQPVAADVQRAALDLLAQHVLSTDSFALSPSLQRKLAPDFEERGEGGQSTDYPIIETLSGLKKALLGQLMSDSLASRMLDSEGKSAPGAAMTLSELYRRIGTAVWSELDSRADILTTRRELQRDHVNRLSAQLLRPSTGRTDTRAVLRTEARALLKRLQVATARKGLSPESRAHLEDSLETLDLALKARLQRVGL